jgi:4-amino-4-deoxy-L-arabinose transferase-like glycosyltransferase
MFDYRVLLALLLLLFLSLGLIYSTTIPLFEAPDEVWHYAYVRYLVDKHTLPSLIDTESGAYQEVAQPPLYYVVAALTSGFVKDDDLSQLMWHNPGFGYQAGVTVNDNKNMLVHTEREEFPWRGATLAIHMARLVSLALGLLTVVSAWGLGREAFPEHPLWALSVAAVVALTPQFLFMSSVVSNDSAAAACSTAALWAIARTANRGPTRSRSVIIGLLVGLAALVKTSCLLLGPLAMMGLTFACRSRSRKMHCVVGHLSLVAVIASSIGGWWYLHNAIVYQDPLATQVHINTPWGRSAPATIGTLLAELPMVYRSFWGAFGWGHVQYTAWVYLAIGATLIASLIGWIWTIGKGQRDIPTSPSAVRRVVLLALTWWSVEFFALLQWMRQVQAPHGRLLFPAIGAWALLVVGGWSSLPQLVVFRGSHATLQPQHLAAVFLAGLGVLSLLTPWLVIRPAFTPPRLMSPDDAADTVEGTQLTYGDRARLLGVALDRASAAPGGTLAIRACWEALAPMSSDYTVFVHLVGGKNERVAERHTYPGLGRFPTSLWKVGHAFCDVYQVHIEDWAPVPELYDVVIGLYDESTGERLVARDPAGTEVGLSTLAQVRIAPDLPLPEMPGRPLDYQVGDQITLLGYQLSGPLQSGKPLTVTLIWRADGTPQEDLIVFVHLLDGQSPSGGNSPELLAQHDGPPRYGRYPTWAWQSGDVIPDEHPLEVPELPAGHPVLVTGMYRADTLERLPIVGPDGPMPDDLIPLLLEFP